MKRNKKQELKSGSGRSDLTGIRLGCIHCDRTDYLGVDSLPEDWFKVYRVEHGDNLEDEDLTTGMEFLVIASRFETHLGICPQCRLEIERHDHPLVMYASKDGFDVYRFELETSVHPLIQQIIDRDCHISENSREVVRYLISKLAKGQESLKAWPVEERWKFIRQCVELHRANLQVYTEVMSGSQQNVAEGQTDDLKPSITGADISKLMRQHKQTIASLAFRLGTSQKRVRQVRMTGLTHPLAVRDWIETITGNDPGPIPSKIRLTSNETTCNFCGVSLEVGEIGYQYVGETFCSQSCCRRSRGW